MSNTNNALISILNSENQQSKERTQFVWCLSVFSVYLCCLSSWKCLPSAE